MLIVDYKRLYFLKWFFTITSVLSCKGNLAMEYELKMCC